MRTALLLFAFGLALHALFWLATGDRFDVHAAVFQGDAPVWQQLARAGAAGTVDATLALPLRPPAMQWLVGMLWNGDPTTAWRMRACFVVLAAGVAPLLWLALHRHVPAATAVLAAGLGGACTSTLQLGSGPHAELPYLVAVLATLPLQERLRTGPGTAGALVFGAAHGGLCLLRTEHALVFGGLGLLLALQRAPRWPRTLALGCLGALVPLVPWQLHANALVDAYNTAGAPTLPPPGVPVRGGPPWQAEALARLAGLPAFQRGPVFLFVSDTVRARGGREVAAADLDVVREAYDTWPEPLPHAFVCLYGGLNFFLGNSPEADGRFSGAALDRTPPLRGGPARYPPGLLQNLPPPGKVALSYPPHLDRIVHGYRRGLADLAADPVGGARRMLRKLWTAAAGAAPGLGGYALPIGLSGPRPQVDLVVSDGFLAAAWRALVLMAAAIGLWPLRRAPWLMPWFLFAGARVLVVAGWFGYARQGALCAPLVMLGITLLATRWLRSPRAIWLVLATLLAAEALRALTTTVAVSAPDGSPAHLAPDDVRIVRVDYRHF